jgi:hypothetical protein|tara:strand:- start:287 stop:661 length:375 start_codon:yes stop_codon:yes gene_type:complete
MIKDLIQAKVLAKDWTFTEISNLKETIEKLSSNLYSEMSLSERFQLIREVRINDGYVGSMFEDAMRDAIMASLQGEVAGIIREMLNGATVNFRGQTHEISERSVGGKSHQERTTNEKENREDEE